MLGGRYSTQFRMQTNNNNNDDNDNIVNEIPKRAVCHQQQHSNGDLTADQVNCCLRPKTIQTKKKKEEKFIH